MDSSHFKLCLYHLTTQLLEFARLHLNLKDSESKLRMQLSIYNPNTEKNEKKKGKDRKKTKQFTKTQQNPPLTTK